MKNKALCITNSYSKNPNNVYKYHRLKEEFSLLGVSLDEKDALDLLPSSCGDSIDIPFIDDYDFVINFDKDVYLAKAISDKKVMFNSYDSLVLSDDKMLSILALHSSSIRCPKTIPAPLCYLNNPDEKVIDSFISKIENELSYPLVFKENHGSSLGKQVSLVHDRAELIEIYKEHIHIPHLYEEFVSSNPGHDYRLIVIGDKVIASMERINKNDFRSNIALGGIGVDVTDTIPEIFKETAIKAAKTLKLDYAGIDLAIAEDGTPLFLEANGNAFFTEIEKISKKNIAKELVSYIYKKIYTE